MGRQIDTRAAIDWLHQAEHVGQSFIWLHFKNLPVILEGWPLEHVELPEAFGDTLKEGSTMGCKPNVARMNAIGFACFIFRILCAPPGMPPRRRPVPPAAQADSASAPAGRRSSRSASLMVCSEPVADALRLGQFAKQPVARFPRRLVA
ncbi:hypothetical protein QU487_18085 [Crenobacter sp. SG2305]|uniref:hypothetical protein n=1 Tax=Crenobacter oryzisoli TaxID=3056844 RepID=UPI0025AA6D2F|nr:hypothetical protein [Crenobacter sp. SG2305]MDN0084647.1 hypothetical protein [Crenobacter sp. SG2305]